MVSLRGLLTLLKIPVRLIWTIIKYPFFGGINDKFKNNLKKSLRLEAFRSGLELPVKDLPDLGEKNDVIMNNFLKSRYPRLTALNNFGKRFDEQSIWLVEAKSRCKSNPIIIYCHGGGFMVGTDSAQLESLLSIYHLLDDGKRERTSFLILEYGLAGRGHLVGSQLYELLSTYEKLANEGNDNIILMGDSAGANMSIALLQYLKRQTSTNLPWPRSTVLISPWVKLVPDEDQLTPGHSYCDNEKRDLLNSQFAGSKERIDALFGGNSYADLLISPGNLPYNASDWNDIPTFNNQGYSTFVLLGEHEVFRDDIFEWAKYALGSPLAPQKRDSQGIFNSKVHEYKTVGKDGAYIDIVVEPWGIHDLVMLFENIVIQEIEKNPHLKVNTLSKKEYFGVVSIVNFLNKTLAVGEEAKKLLMITDQQTTQAGSYKV